MMTPKQEAALRLALEALEASKRTHHYCEDTWYSCPKHEDGCANESEGDECNCGADEANAQLDKAITALRRALEQQPAEEPVGEMRLSQIVDGMIVPVVEQNLPVGTKLYTRPQPVAQWVDLSFEDSEEIIGKAPTVIEAVQMTEAKLKEKNT